MSDEAVLEAFLDAALGDGDRVEARFDPWVGSFRPLVLGEASGGHVLVLDTLVAWLRATSGLRIGIAGAEPATLGVVFSAAPHEELSGHLWHRAGAPFFENREALRTGLADAGTCFSLRDAGRRVGLVAAQDGPALDTLPCLARSLLGIIGLRHQVSAHLPSVLSRAGIAVEPTPLDRLLVAVATDPVLRPGMREAELRAALPAVIGQYRTWHGFDALAEGLAHEDHGGDGDVFAPSAQRTLNAFLATAVPGGGPVSALVRWEAEAEVHLHLRGPITPTLRAQLGWIFDWAAAATGLRFRPAPHARTDGLTFLFAPTLERIWDEHGPVVAAVFGNDRRRFDAAVANPAVSAEGSLTLLHHTVPGGALVRTISLIATDGPPTLTLRRISRETLRALGLRGSGEGVGHSLLDTQSLALQPSALDDRLLRLVYAPTLAPGMVPVIALTEAARLLGRPTRHSRSHGSEHAAANER